MSFVDLWEIVISNIWYHNELLLTTTTNAMSVQFWEWTECNIDHEDFKTKFCFEYPTIFIVWYACSGTVSCNVTLLMARVSGVSLYSTCTFRSWNLGGSSGVQFYAVALQSFCTSYVLKLAQIGCKYPSALCCSLRLNNSISRPNGFSGNLRFPKRILVAFVFFRIT